MKEAEICDIIIEKIDKSFDFSYDYSIDDILTYDAIIFGGIVRDIIADGDCKNSKDMDIVVSKTSFRKIIEILEKIGYSDVTVKYNAEIASAYDDMSFDLYVYENSELKRIDLIVPKIQTSEGELNTEMFIDEITMNFRHLLTVDLSSSLVGYNKCIGLLYNNEKELGLIKRKIFKFNRGIDNSNPRFKSQKAQARANKLIEKEWVMI